MCNPMAIVMVASMAVSAYATYDSGQTQKQFANQEAKQASADAQAEKGDAQVEANRIMRMKQAALADANVALAGSGQDLSSAGAMGINREVARGANEDAYFALIGGRDRAARVNLQGKYTKARGQEQARGATFSAFGQMAQAASTGWTTYKKGTT